MPFQIIRNDITKMPVDAIVNAANSSLLGGGGVDGAIHRAAGPELLSECRALGGCPTGEAKVTKGYRLPARYVIHTVGPIWRGGDQNEEALLRACYRHSLELAVEQGCEAVAFPLISAGAYGYPKAQAVQVAVSEIGKFLMDHDLTVYLVVFDKAAFQVSGKLVTDIQEYIDQHYVGTHFREGRADFPARAEREGWEPPAYPSVAAPTVPAQPKGAAPSRPAASPRPSVPAPETVCGATMPADFVVDESFSQMLLRKIDEAGITDAQCYKRANIDRKLFNKIKNTPHYKPSKPTAVAFAIALKLNLKETKELLEKAGFALSHSFKFDLIIEYFIRQKNYDVFEINEALFAFDQVLLGA